MIQTQTIGESLQSFTQSTVYWILLFIIQSLNSVCVCNRATWYNKQGFSWEAGCLCYTDVSAHSEEAGQHVTSRHHWRHVPAKLAMFCTDQKKQQVEIWTFITGQVNDTLCQIEVLQLLSRCFNFEMSTWVIALLNMKNTSRREQGLSTAAPSHPNPQCACVCFSNFRFFVTSLCTIAWDTKSVPEISRHCCNLPVFPPCASKCFFCSVKDNPWPSAFVCLYRQESTAELIYHRFKSTYLFIFMRI